MPQTLTAGPASPPVTLQLSPEAYFEWEETQQTKHEYIHGEVFPMAGATRIHTRLATNFVIALGIALRDGPCTVYAEGMRVQLEDGERYTYPDLCAACGDEEYADAKQTTLANPTLVVEVLSEGTEAYDRGEKLVAYRGIASLQEIVLVAQDARAAEVYSRTGEGLWTLREVTEGALPLASVGAEIGLDELYAGVEV